MPTVILLVVAVLLTGCYREEYREADNHILYDSTGCAFHVKQGIGESSFVSRVSDADKETCIEAKGE